MVSPCAQEQIKSLLTGLMLSTPPLARAQLSEALSVVSSHDFPRKWATLLPELIERLKTGDAGTVHVSLPFFPPVGFQQTACAVSCKAVALSLPSCHLFVCEWASAAAGAHLAPEGRRCRHCPCSALYVDCCRKLADAYLVLRLATLHL